METRYFQTLVEVAEQGSFSRAAEALNITQSAASQRIKFLEEQYGHRLLDRSGSSLVPTRAGELVLSRARGIVEMESRLREELRDLDEKKRLSLCCTPTFGMAYLPPALNEFMLQNSDVADIKFVFQQPREAMRGLRSRTFDLAIVEHFEDCGVESLEAVSLPRDELVFVSAPSLALPGPELHLESLLPHRLYARRDGCSSKQLLIHNLSAAGRSIDDFSSVVISDDLRFTVEAVLAGSGISFVSRSVIEGHLAAGRLRAHHVEGFRHFRCRSALFAPGRGRDQLVSAFLDCVISVFGERGGGGGCDRGDERSSTGRPGLVKKAQSG